MSTLYKEYAFYIQNFEQNGDLAFVGIVAHSAIIPPATGWTTLYSGVSQTFNYYFGQHTINNDQGTIPTFQFAADTKYAAFNIQMSGATGLDGTPTANFTNSNATSCTAKSIKPTQSNDIAVIVWIVDANTAQPDGTSGLTPPASLGALFNGAGALSMAGCELDLTNTSPTGNQTMTWVSPPASAVGIQFLFKGPPGFFIGAAGSALQAP
jgi:hypothetical protein